MHVEMKSEYNRNPAWQCLIMATHDWQNQFAMFIIVSIIIICIKRSEIQMSASLTNALQHNIDKKRITEYTGFFRLINRCDDLTMFVYNDIDQYVLYHLYLYMLQTLCHYICCN